MSQSAPGTTRPTGRLLLLGTLPVAATVVVGLMAIDLLLIAFSNITDYGTNLAFVQHVLSMDTTNFGGKPGVGLDPAVMWRAITSPVLQNLAYIALIAWETVTGIVLAVATVYWFRERGTGYVRARSWSTIGLIMVIVLFVGGFIVAGGEWFEMWRSTEWNGLDAALRYAILAFFALVLVQLPSAFWERKPVTAV